MVLNDNMIVEQYKTYTLKAVNVNETGPLLDLWTLRAE